MPLRFEQVDDDELDDLLERARYGVKLAKGLRGKDKRGRKLKQANVFLEEIQREKEDRKSIVPEINEAGRKALNIATLGYVDDNRYAEYATRFNGTTVEQELDKILYERNQSKDNVMTSALTTAGAALATATRSALIAGKGATRLGTAIRQGTAGAVEVTPFVYDKLESVKTYVADKNLREGTDFDELSYADFMEATGTILLGGAAGAAGGAAMGARRTSMGEATDWASSSSGKTYTTSVKGGRTEVDEMADESLDSVQSTATAAQPMMNAALEEAKYARNLAQQNPEIRPKRAAGSTGPRTDATLEEAMLGEVDLTPSPTWNGWPKPKSDPTLRGQEWAIEDIRQLESEIVAREALAGGRPDGRIAELRQELAGMKANYGQEFSERGGIGKFSNINDKPWSIRKSGEQIEEMQKGWRDASTLGEISDAVTRAGKNFVKDKIWGVDMRLAWDVSENLGRGYQMANTRAIRGLTNDIKEFVEPAQKVFKLNQEDPYFQALLLDFGANSPTITRKRVEEYITRKLSKADADAFVNYTEWSRKSSHESLRRYSGINNDAILTRNHLHSKLTPAAKERKKKDKEKDYDELELPVDPATLRLERNFYFSPDPRNTSARPQPSDYLPLLQTDLRRIMTNRLAVEVSTALDMPAVTMGRGPEAYLKTMQSHFVKKGVSEQGADYAIKQIKDHMIGINQSPELWLQALNNGAYGYVLSGPKSAMLNLHDPAMATVNFEVPLTEIPRALYRAYTNKAGADVIKSGIDQNVGEFVNDHINTLQALSKGGQGTQRWWADKTRAVTNQMMKIGQFERTDIYSKNGTLNVILDQMVREAKDGTFMGKWGFYMPPEKMNKLVVALKKNGADFRKYKSKEEFDLVEDITFAGLGQQQLIAGSGRSAAWARNPNLRPMWALRGFASQQQGILMWKTVDRWRKGDKKGAMKYLGMYASVVGGSFGMLNESRQWLFGDGNFDLTGVFMGMADQLVSTASVNTIGLNDYQWGRIMEVGVPQAFAESLVPIAFDVPFSVGSNFVDTLQGEQGPMFPIGQVPLVKQTLALPQNMVENLSENLNSATFGTVDVAPYIVDPQQEVLKRVGLLRQRNQD